MNALDEEEPQTELLKVVSGNSSGRRNSGSAQEIVELGPKIMDV
jgi:hypothetical protein